MTAERFILLSFDVEEFDMPLEYGYQISKEEQLRIGKKGLDSIAPILSHSSIQSTLFTTANFADHFPETIRELSKQHEIASHTYYHSSFVNEDLLLSKQTLETISGKPVYGLRMPRMRKVDMNEVKKAGYLYDSSVNPTWLPGRYNNLHLPRTQYTEAGICRIPASVSPNFRIPLFWLSFKNMPLQIFKHLALQTLKKDGYLCLYFHPWEFTDINHYQLPMFTRRWCVEQLLERLNKTIQYLQKEGEFISMHAYINKKPR
jgi:hypothetical protein